MECKFEFPIKMTKLHHKKAEVNFIFSYQSRLFCWFSGILWYHSGRDRCSCRILWGHFFGRQKKGATLPDTPPFQWV